MKYHVGQILYHSSDLCVIKAIFKNHTTYRNKMEHRIIIQYFERKSNCDYRYMKQKYAIDFKNKGNNSYNGITSGICGKEITTLLTYTKLAQKLYPKYVKYTIEEKDYLVPKKVIDTMNKK